MINSEIDNLEKQITDLDIKTIALSLELSGSLVDQLDGLVKNLYKFFTEKDASLLEINPLIIEASNIDQTNKIISDGNAHHKAK